MKLSAKHKADATSGKSIPLARRPHRHHLTEALRPSTSHNPRRHNSVRHRQHRRNSPTATGRSTAAPPGRHRQWLNRQRPSRPVRTHRATQPAGRHAAPYRQHMSPLTASSRPTGVGRGESLSRAVATRSQSIFPPTWMVTGGRGGGQSSRRATSDPRMGQPARVRVLRSL